MKTCGRMVMLLVVLGLCRLSQGEILVYKFTQTMSWFEQEGGEWDVRQVTLHGYDVLEINYNDYTLTQANSTLYWTDAQGKWFQQELIPLTLTRVTHGNKTQWLVTHKNDALALLVGLARPRSIGTGQNREVAATLSGYAVTIEGEAGDQYLDMSKIKLTLHSSWTSWANGAREGQGYQNFDATVQMIKNYLVAKGYAEES